MAQTAYHVTPREDGPRSVGSVWCSWVISRSFYLSLRPACGLEWGWDVPGIKFGIGLGIWLGMGVGMELVNGACDVPTGSLGLVNGARGVVVPILYASDPTTSVFANVVLGRTDRSTLAGSGTPTCTLGTYPWFILADGSG